MMPNDEMRAAAERAVNTRSAMVCLPATDVLRVLDAAQIPLDIDTILVEAKRLRDEVAALMDAVEEGGTDAGDVREPEPTDE